MGQRGPKARQEAGPGQSLAPKVPVPLAAVQQSSPEGEAREAAAEVVTVLCQLEVGEEQGREEFLVCLAQGLGLSDGGSPGPQLPQEMMRGGDGDPLPPALEA